LDNIDVLFGRAETELDTMGLVPQASLCVDRSSERWTESDVARARTRPATLPLAR
jgi:hypothetical protein